MSESVRVLILGAGPLSHALRLAARGRSRLDCGQYGASALCFNLGQARQALEVWRGEREIPDDIKPLCATARQTRLRVGSTPFRNIDAAILEPVSPVELVFRGFSLSWAAIVKTLLVPIRDLGPDEARVVNAWLRGGLLVADESKRANAAAELVDLVPGANGAADFARAVILETRSRLVEPVNALAVIQALVGRPIGLIADSPSRTAGEEANGSDGAFHHQLDDAARRLNMPTFIADDGAARHRLDVSIVRGPEAFSQDFPPVLVDEAIKFITALADSGPDLSHAAFDPTPSPFSEGYAPTRFEEKKARAVLEAKGVRLLPFAFDSALAIVSDLDGAHRGQYEAYTDQLVGRFGFDFGDSTWLQWNYSNNLNGALGFGFFSPDGTTGREHRPEMFDVSRTIFESIAAYHNGNVDHLHAFFNNGPQVVVAKSPRALRDGRIAFDLSVGDPVGLREYRDFAIMAVCVVMAKGETIGVRALAVEGRDGALTEDFAPTPYDAPPDGRQYHLFSLMRPADDPRRVVLYSQAKAIVITPKDAGADVERILVASGGGRLILERLNYLRAIYNIYLTLITEHAAFHFRNPKQALASDLELRRFAKTNENSNISGNGCLLDGDGELIFSTDPDHPHSLFRVFPDICGDLDLRFIVPKAASGAMGFSPFELVTPSPTRAGGGVYWARRALPPTASGAPPEKTRHSTFAARITRMIEASDCAPGLFWPIYTHLGGLDGETVPTPYFDEGVMSELQDRAFDISGGAPPGGRIWVARASVIYDYALMLRGIGEHIARPGPDEVAITSWRDPVLGKTMPRSKGQIYGLTFYVDDPARAEVRLDGASLETLVFNPPDETGRRSVTIAECDIRHLLFDTLDPTVNRPGEIRLTGGTWDWRPSDGAERAFGRLTVAVASDGAACLTVPLHGWAAAGAQLATFAVRRHGDARFALEFETLDGGRFAFGDRSFIEARLADFTASYVFDPALFAAGDWRALAVPFHDLAWNSAARPGGPLPSHPLKSLTLRCVGEAGAAIDLARLAFLRPRASAVADGPEGFCLGGALTGYAGGEVVHLARRDANPTNPRQMTVDQRGFFCFDRVPRGVYEVRADTPFGSAHDRRGPLVEVQGDTMTLALAAAPARRKRGRRAAARA